MSQLGNTIINGAARVNGILTANSAAIPSITGNLNGVASNATVAASLSTSAGSATQPIYFSGGKPIVCNTTLDVCINGVANKATNDSDGNKINVTYVKAVSNTNMNIGTYLRFLDTTTGNVETASAIDLGGFHWAGKTYGVALYGELPTLADRCNLVIKLGDDADNKISIRRSTSTNIDAGNQIETAWIGANGDAKFGTITANLRGNVTGNLTGTASNATKASSADTATNANNIKASITTGTSAYPILFHSSTGNGTTAAVYKTNNATLTKDGVLSVASAKVGSNWTISKSGTALVFTYA